MAGLLNNFVTAYIILIKIKFERIIHENGFLKQIMIRASVRTYAFGYYLYIFSTKILNGLLSSEIIKLSYLLFRFASTVKRQKRDYCQITDITVRPMQKMVRCFFFTFFT